MHVHTQFLEMKICFSVLQGPETLFLFEVQTILIASEVVQYGSVIDALNAIKASYAAGI